ncbi:MAG: ABC transporter permease [Promethearchaeota archaeon]
MIVILLGFNPLGCIGSLFSVMFIGMLFSLFSIGLGILHGLKVKTEGASTVVTLTILMTFSYISGLFIPLEIMPKEMQTLAYFFPSFHANNAIFSVIARGASLLSGQVLVDMLFLLITGFIVYLVS